MNCGSKIALALLFVSGINLIADTKVGQLTKVFDATYKRTFGGIKNLLKNELQSPDNLIASVADINSYIDKNEKRYVDVSDRIVAVMTQLISTVDSIYRKYIKPVNGEVIMLNYTNWADMKQVADQNLNEAQENIKKAKKEFKNIMGKTNKELHNLVEHMIESFDDALEKVVNDFQTMRIVSKREAYTRKQAEEVSVKVLGINRSDMTNKQKWGEIMDVIGFDNQVTNENEDMAISKFDNADKKVKEGVEQIIVDLYGSLPKKK